MKIIIIFLIIVCSCAICWAAASQDALPAGEAQVTFIELGSLRCIPCKQMKPVMEAIEKEYAGKVKVVFHDVSTKEGKPYGEQYGIRIIPTQVFIDKSGKEIARHEGYFSKEAIEKVLCDAGVQK